MSKQQAARFLISLISIPFLAGLGVLTGWILNIEVNNFNDAMGIGCLGFLILAFIAVLVAAIGVTFFNWDLE